MVNDGDILVAMADVAVKRAGKLAKNVSQYNAAAIGRSLREEYGTESDMDWAKLGRDCAGIFRAPPELSFLCGPLQKPEKEKKKAERRKKVHDDDGEEETQYQTTSGLKEGEAQVARRRPTSFDDATRARRGEAPGKIAFEARHTISIATLRTSRHPGKSKPGAPRPDPPVARPPPWRVIRRGPRAADRRP